MKKTMFQIAPLEEATTVSARQTSGRKAPREKSGKESPEVEARELESVALGSRSSLGRKFNRQLDHLHEEVRCSVNKLVARTIEKAKGGPPSDKQRGIGAANHRQRLAERLFKWRSVGKPSGWAQRRRLSFRMKPDEKGEHSKLASRSSSSSVGSLRLPSIGRPCWLLQRDERRARHLWAPHCSMRRAHKWRWISFGGVGGRRSKGSPTKARPIGRAKSICQVEATQAVGHRPARDESPHFGQRAANCAQKQARAAGSPPRHEAGPEAEARPRAGPPLIGSSLGFLLNCGRTFSLSSAMVLLLLVSCAMSPALSMPLGLAAREWRLEPVQPVGALLLASPVSEQQLARLASFEDQQEASQLAWWLAQNLLGSTDETDSAATSGSNQDEQEVYSNGEQDQEALPKRRSSSEFFRIERRRLNRDRALEPPAWLRERPIRKDPRQTDEEPEGAELATSSSNGGLAELDQDERQTRAHSRRSSGQLYEQVAGHLLEETLENRAFLEELYEDLERKLSQRQGPEGGKKPEKLAASEELRPASEGGPLAVAATMEAILGGQQQAQLQEEPASLVVVGDEVSDNEDVTLLEPVDAGGPAPSGGAGGHAEKLARLSAANKGGVPARDLLQAAGSVLRARLEQPALALAEEQQQGGVARADSALVLLAGGPPDRLGSSNAAHEAPDREPSAEPAVFHVTEEIDATPDSQEQAGGSLLFGLGPQPDPGDPQQPAADPATPLAHWGQAEFAPPAAAPTSEERGRGAKRFQTLAGGERLDEEATPGGQDLVLAGEEAPRPTSSTKGARSGGAGSRGARLEGAEVISDRLVAKALELLQSGFYSRDQLVEFAAKLRAFLERSLGLSSGSIQGLFPLEGGQLLVSLDAAKLSAADRQSIGQMEAQLYGTSSLLLTRQRSPLEPTFQRNLVAILQAIVQAMTEVQEPLPAEWAAGLNAGGPMDWRPPGQWAARWPWSEAAELRPEVGPDFWPADELQVAEIEAALPAAGRPLLLRAPFGREPQELATGWGASGGSAGARLAALAALLRAGGPDAWPLQARLAQLLGRHWAAGGPLADRGGAAAGSSSAPVGQLARLAHALGGGWGALDVAALLLAICLSGLLIRCALRREVGGPRGQSSAGPGPPPAPDAPAHAKQPRPDSPPPPPPPCCRDPSKGACPRSSAGQRSAGGAGEQGGEWAWTRVGSLRALWPLAERGQTSARSQSGLVLAAGAQKLQACPDAEGRGAAGECPCAQAAPAHHEEARPQPGGRLSFLPQKLVSLVSGPSAKERPASQEMAATEGPPKEAEPAAEVPAGAPQFRSSTSYIRSLVEALTKATGAPTAAEPELESDELPADATLTSRQRQQQQQVADLGAAEDQGQEVVMSQMDISAAHLILDYMEKHLEDKERLRLEWQELNSQWQPAGSLASTSSSSGSTCGAPPEAGDPKGGRPSGELRARPVGARDKRPPQSRAGPEPARALQRLARAALSAQNVAKNRNPQVLPFDRNRVRLGSGKRNPFKAQQQQHQPATNSHPQDYINASFIYDDDPRHPTHIIAQGPTEQTSAHFWQMIWEQEVSVIVMLTRLNENGKQMCHCYWPSVAFSAAGGQDSADSSSSAGSLSNGGRRSPNEPVPRGAISARQQQNRRESVTSVFSSAAANQQAAALNAAEQTGALPIIANGDLGDNVLCFEIALPTIVSPVGELAEQNLHQQDRQTKQRQQPLDKQQQQQNAPKGQAGSPKMLRLEVHLVSEHVSSNDYVVRNMYLINRETGATRTITQFHYLAWPESRTPESVRSFLQFRRKVHRSFRATDSPTLVHCSDGAGRSGTYTLIDLILERLKNGAKEIDLKATLEHLRDQRVGLCANQSQFEFVLVALAEEIQIILNALPR